MFMRSLIIQMARRIANSEGLALVFLARTDDKGEPRQTGGVNAHGFHPYRNVFHGRTVTKAERRVKAGKGVGVWVRLS